MNATAELNEQKMHIIGELQTKWRCEKHSKDQDVYCYSTDGNVCLTLTHGNLVYWALEIVCPLVLTFQNTNTYLFNER